MDRLNKFADELQQEIIDRARSHYTETVVDHWLHPRNLGSLKDPDGHAGFRGPCGDRMEIYLRVHGDTIRRACFLTDGCGTSIAAASMAVQLAEGKTLGEACDISQELILQQLGGLPEESEHCAFLASITLKAAIADYLQRRPAPAKPPDD
jgi:nitrogen fixation NifU-like protein